MDELKQGDKIAYIGKKYPNQGGTIAFIKPDGTYCLTLDDNSIVYASSKEFIAEAKQVFKETSVGPKHGR